MPGFGTGFVSPDKPDRTRAQEPPMIRSRTIMLLLGIAGAFFHAAAPAQTVYCVGTSAELDTALSQAFSVNGNVEIRLRAGIYTTGGSTWVLPAQSSVERRLSGGWTGVANQCSSQSLPSGASVLDAGGTGFVLQLSTGSNNTTGVIRVDNLTLTGGHVVSGLAGCLFVNAAIGSPTILIDRVVLAGCRNEGSGHGGAVRIQNNTPGTIALRNSLVVDNFTGGLGAIAVTTIGGVTAIEHNTIVRNSAGAADGGAVVRLFSSPSLGELRVRNNVIHGNAAPGTPSSVQIFGSTALENLLSHNAVDAPITGPHTATATLVTADPGFVSATSDWRLRPDSALVDAGLLFSPPQSGVDLDGAPRIRGPAPDIGAYEAPSVQIFADGFE
jgi:hypothetical protein